MHACWVASVMSNSATPWTVAHQAPLSTGFSRQEYWSGLPCPSPGNLPDPGIEPASFTSPALAEGSLPLAPHGKPSRSPAHPKKFAFFFVLFQKIRGKESYIIDLWFFLEHLHSSKISTSLFLGELDICFSKDRLQSAESSRSQLKCTHLLSFIKQCSKCQSTHSTFPGYPAPGRPRGHRLILPSQWPFYRQPISVPAMCEHFVGQTSHISSSPSMTLFFFFFHFPCEDPCFQIVCSKGVKILVDI